MNKENTKPNEINMLAAWIEFLRDPESETVEKLAQVIPEIKEAKELLIEMSNDETHRKIYEERVKEIGKEIGREEGEKRKAIEIAKSLLDILDIETIALKTGLSVDEINKLK